MPRPISAIGSSGHRLTAASNTRFESAGCPTCSTTRPGQPTTLDLVAGTVGILLLLEATRRSLGLPMVIVALVFIFYTFAGQYMPDVIQHRGASLVKFLNHQWLTTEGVFGIALGVSTSFVFLFVLFGTLLEKAGAGNWMMQISTKTRS